MVSLLSTGNTVNLPSAKVISAHSLCRLLPSTYIFETINGSSEPGLVKLNVDSAISKRYAESCIIGA